MAGLPHHAGLVSGFCSSNPSLRPRLPSDSASRRTPLPSLAVPVITARRGLAPPKNTTCLAHQSTVDLSRSERPTVLALPVNRSRTSHWYPVKLVRTRILGSREAPGPCRAPPWRTAHTTPRQFGPCSWQSTL